MHGAGAFLGELQQLGRGHQQHQQNDHHAGEHQALTLSDRVGPAQGEALLQKDNAHQNTGDEAQQTGHGGQVAAAQTDDHAQGAAQEHQRADHHEQAQHKAAGGGGPGTAPELPGGHGGKQRAQHDADDLRTDVLHLGGAVQAQSARDVTLEAGDAEAHVLRVSGGGEDQGGYAHHHAGQQDQPVVPQPTVFFHFKISPPVFSDSGSYGKQIDPGYLQPGLPEPPLQGVPQLGGSAPGDAAV